jgi:tetratricopeptide (TPR) repeat protein
VRDHAHVQITARLGDSAPVYAGWVDGIEAIIRCAPPGGPLGDPRSAFYGGQGLVPPFRPRVHHEALVWARVEPTRLLAHGVGPEGPYVALRRLPGVTLDALGAELPLGIAFVEAVLVQLATELAALHSVGVLHRNLHPGTVLLVDGQARLAGLADALVDGNGPPIGRPALDARGDLHALGRVARWMLGDRPIALLGRRLGEVLSALLDPAPARRPAAANDVLRALGAPPGPPAALPAPHPALVAWSGATWADRLLAQGRSWEVVRGADEAGLDRWALAALAGRIVLADPGTEGWLALGTLCWMLGETVQGSEREAYRAQAEEARARADAPWHPAARGLEGLLDRGEGVAELCDTGQYERAARWARAAGGGGALAMVGWSARDTDLVEEGLAGADVGDLDAIRVAASRVLVAAPRDVSLGAARVAYPRAQLDAVRGLCTGGAEAEAARLAACFPEPAATRARLVIALYTGERAESLAIARVLAMRSLWDPTVAAALVAHAPEGEPLRVPARRLLAGLARAESLPALGDAAVAGVGADPADPVGWSGLLCARVAAGEVDRAATELEQAGGEVGAAAWRLFALELVASGRLDNARAALLGALRRYPADTELAALDAALSLLDGDIAAACRMAEHALAQDPAAPFGWLARAACALWTGDASRARADLAAAARQGAPAPPLAALSACLPELAAD